MENAILVLVTRGKRESVDYATVHLFPNMKAAQDFCAEKSTGREKYWTNAEIVNNEEEIELMQPEE